MFFTFWGLCFARSVPIREKDLWAYVQLHDARGMHACPLGDELGGMGPLLAKHRMKKKQVEQLETMPAQAKAPV